MGCLFNRQASHFSFMYIYPKDGEIGTPHCTVCGQEWCECGFEEQEMESTYGTRYPVSDHRCHCGKDSKSTYWCSLCERTFGYCSIEHESKAVKDWVECCDARIRKFIVESD